VRSQVSLAVTVASLLATACSSGSINLDGDEDAGSPPGIDAASDVDASPIVDAALAVDAPIVDAAPPPIDAPPPDAAPPPPPTQDVTVVAFDNRRIFFGNGGSREIEQSVAFPPHGPWKTVTMRLTLSCPQQGCDPWDRAGALGVKDESGNHVREIARFMTPYGVGGSWNYDVTDLQPMFTGGRTMRAFIDTWVDSGWVVTVRFDFKAGTPARIPVKVLPMGWKDGDNVDRGRVVYGDPNRSIGSQMPERTIHLPASGFSQARMFVITTGHGQGNAQNCAEFCPKKHYVVVNGQAKETVIWRDDCEFNPINNQGGTWQYDRAGWCPGADVKPWIVDLGTSLAPGSQAKIRYDVEGYENTCRPDSPVCTGCVFNTPCSYDGGAHTEPTFLVTAHLVLYK
jgi:hypothetical protein